jgi:uncharacterized cupredoxin-like copper-binding protein
MKNTIKYLLQSLTILVLFLFSHAIFAQKVAVADSVAQIKFQESTHDFGTIKEGEKLEHIFKFENIGKKSLTIANVMTTCGCTATHWTKKVLAPGEKGEITVRFDTKGKIGQQTKIVTVISNAYNARERLFIRTVVVKKE